MTSSSRHNGFPPNPHRSAAPDPPGAVLARRGFGDPGRQNGDGWGELEDDWKLLEAAGREQKRDEEIWVLLMLFFDILCLIAPDLQVHSCHRSN